MRIHALRFEHDGGFLIAIGIIFTVPYLIWRLGKTDYYAPLVVVQIITGILLGPASWGEFSRITTPLSLPSRSFNR